MAALETLTVDITNKVATITLNRPEALNSFNSTMRTELVELWGQLRGNDDVNVIVVTGAGDRAFCTGIDRTEAMGEIDLDSESLDGYVTPFMFDDPGQAMSPKSNELWKPIIVAVNGMACGGAFYLLGEADIIICSETATFFDPHVTYGMTAAFEPIQLLGRMDFGDLMRMSLLGASERISASTALRAGLVTEVVAPGELLARATELAEIVAAAPPLATQGTIRSLWLGRELSRRQALDTAYLLVAQGTSKASLAEGQERFSAGARVEWRLR